MKGARTPVPDLVVHLALVLLSNMPLYASALLVTLVIRSLCVPRYHLVSTTTKSHMFLLAFSDVFPVPPPTEEPRTPCNPSPCGANAVCKEQNGAGSCACLSEYFGDPYTGCRPECVINSDCDRSRACANNKCVDPCPGTCGVNAECQVFNHAPSCSCIPGYTGDPTRICNVIQPGTCFNYIFLDRVAFTHTLQLQFWRNVLNRAIRHLADQIVSAVKLTVTLYVHAIPTTRAPLPAANRNASLAPSVLKTKHALSRTAEIHVPELVGSTLCVR